MGGDGLAMNFDPFIHGIGGSLGGLRLLSAGLAAG